MTELHTISVGLTYNIGNFESKRADVTVKVEPTDSRERARNFAVDECALILSGGDPKVYEDCIQKLSGEVNLATVEKLRMNRIELLPRIEHLKDRVIACNQWLKELALFENNQTRWVSLINNRQFWVNLNNALIQLVQDDSSFENNEESQADELPFPDSVPVEEIM